MNRVVVLGVLLFASLMIGCGGGSLAPGDSTGTTPPIQDQVQVEERYVVGSYHWYTADGQNELAQGPVWRTRSGLEYDVELVGIRQGDCEIDLTWLNLIQIEVAYTNKPEPEPPANVEYVRGEWMDYRVDIENNVWFKIWDQTVVATQVDIDDLPLGDDAVDIWTDVDIPPEGLSLYGDWVVEDYLDEGVYYTRVKVSFSFWGGKIEIIIFDEKAGAFEVVFGPPIEFVYASDREGNYEMYLRDIYGTYEQKLAGDPSAVDYVCDFDPTGSILYFNSNRDGDFEVYALDMDTMEITNITHDTSTQYGCAVSPDGEWIVTVQSWSVRNKDIFRLKADGSMDPSEWINLTNTYGIYEHEMDWTPDGEHIVYYKIDSSGNDVWIMDWFDGANAHKVFASSCHSHGPTVTPDGDKIMIFCSMGLGRGVFYYSYSDDMLHTYIDTELEEYCGEYSPDGLFVIFTIGEPGDVYYGSFPDLLQDEPIPLVVGQGNDCQGIWRPNQ